MKPYKHHTGAARRLAKRRVQNYMGVYAKCLGNAITAKSEASWAFWIDQATGTRDVIDRLEQDYHIMSAAADATREIYGGKHE